MLAPAASPAKLASPLNWARPRRRIVSAWGIAIPDDFSKAFLLGWAAWQLFIDAVIQRDEPGVTRDARTHVERLRHGHDTIPNLEHRKEETFVVSRLGQCL